MTPKEEHQHHICMHACTTHLGMHIDTKIHAGTHRHAQTHMYTHAHTHQSTYLDQRSVLLYLGDGQPIHKTGDPNKQHASLETA